MKPSILITVSDLQAALDEIDRTNRELYKLRVPHHEYSAQDILTKVIKHAEERVKGIQGA